MIAIIKVTWSSRFCLLQRRTNIYNIDNKLIGLYEKVVTYEGPEHLSVLGIQKNNGLITFLDSITSPTLASDIQKICKNVAEHIKRINNNKVYVSRMVLHFKVDPMERIWLLYTTGLNVVDTTVK